MAVIDSFEVGGTTYDLNAAALETPATIDGISFDGNESVTRYAACATAGATAAKVVTLGTDLTLAPGATVVVRFNSANTAASPTLNVNGTGAFPIVAYGSTAAASGAWADGEVVTFVYDGTNWNQIGGAVGSASVYGRLLVDTTLALSGAAADAKTVGDRFTVTMSAKTSVPSNADLDDYKTESGMHYVSRAVAATLTNSPWSNISFALYVKSGTTSAATSGQAQFAVGENGEFACRYYWASTWSAWTYYPNTETIEDNLKLTMSVKTSVPSNADLDDYKTETGIHYVSEAVAATLTNSPWSNISFALYVKSGTTSAATSGQAQFAVGENGEFACRYYWASTWSAWTYYVDTNSFYEMIPGAGTVMQVRQFVPADISNDLDNLITSGWYYKATSQSIDNYPFENSNYGYIVVKSGTDSTSYSSGVFQIVYNIYSGSAGIAFRRYTGSVWGPWNYIYQADKTLTKSGFAADAQVTGDSIPAFSLSVFSRIGVCGGSYDSGYSYAAGQQSGQGVTNYNNAWLNILAREYGFTAGVYAAPGTSIDEWFDSSYSHADRCYSLFDSDAACDLYILTFGANDTVSGSVDDCAAFDADPTATPTSFYGWYAKLIYTIRQKAPGAKIVITTPSSENIISAWTAKIAAIREIADYYDIPVMRWMDDAVYAANMIHFTSITTGNHPHSTPYGYAMMAEAFKRCFGVCVRDNYSYFNDWRN